MGIIEKMRLDGRSIFVTGGARGIGKSVATAFAEAGADLAIVDVDIEEAKKTAAELAEENKVRAIAINTASMSGHIVNVPQPQCAYNASKAGVIQLTKSMAVEWATKGVRVNCISPGYIGTELITNDKNLTSLIEKWNEMAPMGRMGKPEELEAICVYLAGDTSSFTTGSDFVIDGAFTCF